MADRSKRRDVWLLVLTHTLAFSVPALPLVPGFRKIARATPGVQAQLAESYSRAVAASDVAAGDDLAAVSGLRRHMDRLAIVRRQLSATGGEEVDFNLLDFALCDALAEVAFLAENAERDARIGDAATCYQKVASHHRRPDGTWVLLHGARAIAAERRPE